MNSTYLIPLQLTRYSHSQYASQRTCLSMPRANFIDAHIHFIIGNS